MSWTDELLAGIRGIGEGATGGLVMYPAAELMIGLDRLVGEGKLTRKEARNLLRAQRRQDLEERPISTIAGNVVGSMVPLGAVARGGATAAKVIGTNAALGASQGFTANDADEGTTLMDTAVGGGVGGVLGAFGVGTTAAARALAAREAKNGLFEKLMRSEEWRTQARKQLKASGVKSPKDADVRALARKQADEQVRDIAPVELAQLVRQPRSTLADRAVAGVKRGFEGVVPAAITGGTVGAVSAPFLGQDPLSGAMVGAGGAIALRKQNAVEEVTKTLSHAGGRVLAANPWMGGIPQTVSPVATNIVTPRLVDTPPQPSIEEFKVNPRRSSGRVTGEFDDLQEFRVRPSEPADDLEQFRVR